MRKSIDDIVNLIHTTFVHDKYPLRHKNQGSGVWLATLGTSKTIDNITIEFIRNDKEKDYYVSIFKLIDVDGEIYYIKYRARRGIDWDLALPTFCKLKETTIIITSFPDI